MTLPNFLIIGAAKSGTTSLASYLNQHPQVFIPPHNKEPNFFILEGLELPPFDGPAASKTLHEKIYKFSITDFETYRLLFQEAEAARAVGEASVPYLYYPQAPQKIKAYLPDVKLIAILRNPVDRLYSHYLMVREKYLLEPLTLPHAIAQEQTRIRLDWGWDWHYASLGMYYTQLRRYYDLFEKDQLKIFLYEDFCQNPVEMVQEIYRYIGVEDTFVPDMSKRSKMSYQSKSLLLARCLDPNSSLGGYLKRVLPSSVYRKAIAPIKKMNRSPSLPLPVEIREDLKDGFREDVLSLQTLINRDLSAWL